MTDRFGFALLCMLAAVGIYHVVMLWFRREERSAVATYDKWLRELHEATHDLIDADIHVAQLEARVMDLVGKVPADTSYQAIRRLGLGRQVEAAILSKMATLGLGEALPTEPLQEPRTVAVAFSRRAPAERWLGGAG